MTYCEFCGKKLLIELAHFCCPDCGDKYRELYKRRKDRVRK
jgi:predicted RNA-binding Zn-ribbon protein involved in translation (DUF1610 family)